MLESDLIRSGLGVRDIRTDLGLSAAVGLVSLETESSPEWLFVKESDILGAGFGAFRLETDPDELELLLVAVASPPSWWDLKGEMGEPRLISLESDLFSTQWSASLSRSLSLLTRDSGLSFLKFDISDSTTKQVGKGLKFVSLILQITSCLRFRFSLCLCSDIPN